MTRIVYKIKGPVGEARELSGTGGTLAVIIDPSTTGYVRLGGAVSVIEDGCALFELSHIKDGDHTPTLSGEVCATLEPIRKEGERITLLPTPDVTVRNLLNRLERTEQTLSTLISRVDKLSTLYGKQVIF